MTSNEIKFFESYLDKSKTVFEYGCGQSTIYFSKFVKKYISVENVEIWYKNIKGKIDNDHTLLYLEQSTHNSIDDEELEKKAYGGRVPAAFGGIMDSATGRKGYFLGSIGDAIGDFVGGAADVG